ncbi:MAG TPA: hypothetical protein VGK54_18020 [Chloroflexota bacterium]
MTEKARLYASTYDGTLVFKPDNGGWKQVGEVPGTESESVGGSLQHPEQVYVADLHRGLFGTEDGGQHWAQLLQGECWAVAVDPTDDNVIYAGTEPIHLYRSENRGKSWEELTGLLDLPEDVKSNWWFPQPPHRGHVYHIFVHPENPNTLYVCLEHGGIVRSFDRGATWEDVTEGIDYPDMHWIRSMPGSQNRYFVAAARGFFRTDNPARGWSRAQKGCERDYFHSFVFLAPNDPEDPPTMLLAAADRSPGYWQRPEGSRSAIYQSTDAARSWHWVGEGLEQENPAMVNMLVNHPADRNGAFAAFGGHRVADDKKGGSIMVTHDRGDSWEDLKIELPPAIGLWAAAE